MFDNLRDESSNSTFFQDDDPAAEEQAPKRTTRRAASSNFLGLTASQRLILSIMFLMMICIMGTLFMVVTGRFFLPF